MWSSGTAFWRESLLSVNCVGPGNPNQVIRLGGKAFPLLGSLTDPQLKKMWVYLEVQVLRECQGEVMAVRAVRLRQKSKFLTEKAFSFPKHNRQDGGEPKLRKAVRKQLQDSLF